MPGTIKKMIDTIITQKSKGDPVIAKTTKVKFVLKGIDPDKYTMTSVDDPAIVEKLKQIAAELCVAV